MEAQSQHRGHPSRQARWACAPFFGVGLLAAMLCCLVMASPAFAAILGKPVAKAPLGTVATVKPTFTWSGVSGARTYEVRVYKGSKLLLDKARLAKTSWRCTKSLPLYTKLTWKVRAVGSRSPGLWSKAFHFMIAAPPARIVDQAGDAQSAVAGSAPSVLPSVLVTDAKGRPVPGASVTFAVASGGGAVTGATAVTNASGLATVGSWTLGTRAGADSLTATCAGLAPVTFHATGVAGPADAATSTLSPTSPSLSADGSSTQMLTVQVRDAYGNDLTSGGDIVTITKLSGSGTIGPVVDNLDGSYSATVTAPTATGSGVFVATLNGAPVEGGGTAQSQATVSYVPGPLAKFALSIAGSQTAGVAFSGTNTVTAEDAYGNTVTSFDASADAVTISATPNDGTISGLGSLGGNVLDRTLDFTNGVASLTGTMVFAGSAGSHTFSATAGLCTGTSQSVTVNPGSATKLTLSGLTSQTAGSAQSLTVSAQDAYGNTATGYRGTVQFSSSDGAAALPASYTFQASDGGVHSFSGVTLKTAGSQTVTASDTSTTSITGGQTVTVSPGSATTLTLSGLTSQTAGSTQSLTVSAQDAYGNTATGYRGTVQFSSSDGAAALPASYTFQASDGGVHSFSGVTLKTAGSQTVTATDTASGTITGSESATVSAGTASALTIETAANGTGTVIGARSVTAGSSFTGYAITRDAYGNFVANASATWSLTNTSGGVAASDLSSTSGASTVFTGHLVGSATLQAVVGSLTGDTGTVTVNPGSATQLTLSGLTSQTAGSTQSLTVSAQDAYGNTATGYRGTVQFSSSYGADAVPASYTFQASDGGVHSFSGVTLKTAGSQTVTATDTASGTITGSESATVSAGTASAAHHRDRGQRNGDGDRRQERDRRRSCSPAMPSRATPTATSWPTRASPGA